MANYRQWLQAQLRYVEEIDAHPAPSLQHLDELRELIAESERRAAASGLPAAVGACRIRPGPIAPAVAREILATCLAVSALPTAETRESLSSVAMSVKQAAGKLGISERVVRDLIAAGELGSHRVGNGRGQVRILPRDLETYQGRGERPALRHLGRG